MADMNKFALQGAEAAGATLWAFSISPFPLANGDIQSQIQRSVTATTINFAIQGEDEVGPTGTLQVRELRTAFSEASRRTTHRCRLSKGVREAALVRVDKKQVAELVKNGDFVEVERER